MSLSVGIVGLPNVGKSTLFNALTKNAVAAENFPFCTIDPSVGVVGVPDERIDILADLSKSVKRIPPAIEFVDIAGLVQGASQGEGLGNKFLSNIREVDAIAHVVRIFDDEKVVHVGGDVNPLRDIQIINMELILADLQTVEKRLASVERDVKRHDKDAIKEKEVIVRLKEVLEAEHFASSASIGEEEQLLVKGLHLLTSKPVLYVLNAKSSGGNIDVASDTRYDELMTYLEEHGAYHVQIDASLEAELSELDEEEQRAMRLEFATDDVSGVKKMIHEAYRLLGLMTYFTTGEDETRGWSVKIDSMAPEAGAAIHTDFRDKFIRADVVSYDDLLSAGSIAQARESGVLRTEGKDYVVQDGDVIEFRI